MKGKLLTTVSFIAVSGTAFAESAVSVDGVKITGSAEMGILGGSPSVGGSDLRFWTDIDVTFTMSGELDNGLTFGAEVDLDAVEDDADQDFAVFVTGDFGRVTLGDTDGAFDWALQEIGLGRGSEDASINHSGYSNNDGFLSDSDSIVRYDYSFGDFAFAAAVELDGDGGDRGYGIGARYSSSFGGTDIRFGFGYEAVGDWQTYGISVSPNFGNGFSADLNYTITDPPAGPTDTYIGVGLDYQNDLWAIGVNYGTYDYAGASESGFGVYAQYDLGGGASLNFGFSSSDPGFGGSEERYSISYAQDFGLGRKPGSRWDPGAGLSIAGRAEAGLLYDTDAGGDSSEFVTDLDFQIILDNNVLDNGLTFGARVDIEAIEDDVDQDYSAFLSGNFGTVTIGDADGPLGWAMKDLGRGWLATDAAAGHAGYNGNGGILGERDNIVRYDYTFSDLSLSVATDLDKDGGREHAYGAGARYKTTLGGADVLFGVGFEAVDDWVEAGFSKSSYFQNGLSTGLNYSVRDFGVGPSETHIGVGFGYDFDAVSFYANYGRYDDGIAARSGYGVSAAYDLGGGASLLFGYGNSEFGGGGDSQQVSLGLAINRGVIFNF